MWETLHSVEQWIQNRGQRKTGTEWTVETMHWLLDVHFGDDFCRVKNENIQQNLNMLRKAALNLFKRYKERAASNRSMSKIMFDCLLHPYFISDILEN